MKLGLDPDDLAACVACGLCLPHCPTFRVTGLEIASPRGRITAMQAVDAGTQPAGREFERAMDECVQCRGCEAACPSGVPFGRLMEGTRAALQPVRHRSVLRRRAEDLAFRVLLVRHRVLLALTWVLVVAQRLRLVPARLGLPRIEVRELRRPLTADPDADVVLFTGCVMDAWMRGTHRNAARVLRAAGWRVGISGGAAPCCGALHLHAGRRTEARRLAQRVIDSIGGTGAVVVDSAGCGAAMREYGQLLGTAAAHTFAARVVDFATAVRDAPSGVAVSRTGVQVVVQDPCHLRHVQHAHAAVREVLAPAYTLAETDDDGLCCGAGGGYQVDQPALSQAIRARKVKALRRAAGDEALLVASANPGCAMHLAAAGVAVAHPADLLAAAMMEPGG